MEEEIRNVDVGAGALDSPQTETGGLETESPSLPAADSPLYKGAMKEEAEGFFKDHIRGLVSQGQRLRDSIPGFDLRKELTDPMFARLTSPQVGLSVEDAYYALHRRELQQQAARMTAGNIGRAIQAGQMRPRENTGSHTGTVQTTDYSKASREQREQLKEAIRHAAAKGEKIYP